MDKSQRTPAAGVSRIVTELEHLRTAKQDLDQLGRTIEESRKNEAILRRALEQCLNDQEMMREERQHHGDLLGERTAAFRHQIAEILRGACIDTNTLEVVVQDALEGKKQSLLLLLREALGNHSVTLSVSDSLQYTKGTDAPAFKEHEKQRLRRLATIAETLRDTLHNKNPETDGYHEIFDFRRRIATDIAPPLALEASSLLEYARWFNRDTAVPKRIPDLLDVIHTNIRRVIGIRYPQHPIIMPHLRWMIRRDMPEVLGIEAGSFGAPWDEEEFINNLRQRNCIGMVAELEEQVIGFMVYELRKTSLEFLNFSVHEDFRRKGIAESMVRKLFGKLSAQRRRSVHAMISEKNDVAIRTFLNTGFDLQGIAQSPYEDSEEDGMKLALHYKPLAETATYPDTRSWLKDTDAFLTRVT